jgi:hypothetical protein
MNWVIFYFENMPNSIGLIAKQTQLKLNWNDKDPFSTGVNALRQSGVLHTDCGHFFLAKYA